MRHDLQGPALQEEEKSGPVGKIGQVAPRPGLPGPSRDSAHENAGTVPFGASGIRYQASA